MSPESKRGVPRRCFSDYVSLQFEGQKFQAMRGYNQMLSIAYGDYMTPPPVEKRVGLHLIDVDFGKY